jgi:hypothetical protein
MGYQRKSLYEYSIEELDRELIARGAQISVEKQFQFTDKEGTPEREVLMKGVKELYDTDITPNPNKALSHISTSKLVKALILKTWKVKGRKGIWGIDNRMDFYAITDERIKKNVDSIAAIFLEENLLEKEKGFSTLKVKNYGKTFNLCDREPFHNQPIAAGRLCTGFLVKGDVIATAGHCADENNVTELRIVFGFKMLGLSTPVTWIPHENIYKGVKIIHRVCDPKGKGPDWELIKLDCKVEGHPVVKLSGKPIYLDQPVYILGHPCGLPLKYSSGAQVRCITGACFAADLNVYSGNSGSPVFDSNTHEVIGIVVRGDTQDFRWTGKGWLSVIYPNPVIRSQEPQCTRVSEFRNIVDKRQ